MVDYMTYSFKIKSELLAVEKDAIRSRGYPKVSGELPLTLRDMDFASTSIAILRKFFARFPVDEKMFTSRYNLRFEGSKIAAEPVGDEETLKYFLRSIVEEPTASIFRQCQEKRYLEGAYNTGSDFAFKTRIRSLDKGSRTKCAWPNGTSFQPDQMCTFKRTGEDHETTAYIIEHKAPHKFPISRLREGLFRIEEGTAPEDNEVRQAVRQTLNHMQAVKVNYGCIMTGEAIVFLRLRKAGKNPVLLYHLAEPTKQVRDNAGEGCTTLMLPRCWHSVFEQSTPFHGERRTMGRHLLARKMEYRGRRSLKSPRAAVDDLWMQTQPCRRRQLRTSLYSPLKGAYLVRGRTSRTRTRKI